jgi:hypothetical protein
MFSRSFSFFPLQFFEDFSFLPPLLVMPFQERKTKLKIKIFFEFFLLIFPSSPSTCYAVSGRKNETENQKFFRISFDSPFFPLY